MGVWARSVGVDIGSFMIYNTFAESATDSPPVSTPMAVPVAGALLVWRRRVVRSELVQRGRGWRLLVRSHLFRHGEVGNTQILKTAPRAPGLNFLAQNSMACTKVGLVCD